MAKTKKSTSPAASTTKSATKTARTLQSASENTRKSQRQFVIPKTAFDRVARAVVYYHGKDMDVQSIGDDTLRALQLFVEASIVDQLDKARMIKGKTKTLTVEHLKIADEAFKVIPGARMGGL